MSAAASPAPGLGRGLVYKGKWKVLHPLTETDRSYVFLGTPVAGGKPVAVKVLKDRRAKDTRFMKIHHADMQAAMALPRHPGLVPVLDAGWTNGRYVVVSQHAPGVPLSTRLTQPRPIPYPAILAAGRQLVALLAFAQQAGIRFRHVEPEHLLLEEESRRVHLLRFSLPRSARLGIDPPRGVGPDLHLAGDLLLRMLCGDQRAPAGKDWTSEQLADHLQARVARAYPEVSPDELHELVGLYNRCTTRDQARRYTDYAQVDAALAQLEGDHEPLREERRRRERDERRDALFSTAYDTVRALTGPAPEDANEDDLRDERIQKGLLAAFGLLLLVVVWSAFS